MLHKVVKCHTMPLPRITYVYTDSFTLICSYLLSVFGLVSLEKFVPIEKMYGRINEIY